MMKAFITFTLLWTFSKAQGQEEEIPKFTWIHAPEPVLKITYPGGDYDVAILKQYNPIPLQPNERLEDVDACIYDGYLAKEEDVYVTVTGCAHSDTFDIQFRSQFLKHHMFSVVAGQALPIPSVFNKNCLASNGNKECYFSKAIEHRKKENFRGISPGLNPKGYTATMKIRYDENFADKHGVEAVNVIRKIYAQVQNAWKLPSLTTSVTLSLNEKIDAVKGRFEAGDMNDVNDAATYSTEAANINLMFAYRNDLPGPISTGTAKSICEKAPLRIAISEYVKNVLTTSQNTVWATAYNLGIMDDYLPVSGADRKDSKGKTCSHIGGIMDYKGAPNIWSTCSVEDFAAFVNSGKAKCLKSN